MTVEELANKRYGGEFVFMLGHLEGVTRFVFECFDPRPDHEGKNTYMVSYFDKGLRRRDMEHVKSVLEASVDYHYPNHPEPEAEPGDMGEVSDGYHTFNIRNNIKTI